jgi:hypothetical protein
VVSASLLAALGLSVGQPTRDTAREPDGLDTFKIEPNGRHELYRRNEIPCRVSVTLTGRGTLDVSLRGN